MPELPEVEAGRAIAEAVAHGRRITGVRCANDPIVFGQVSAVRFRRALLNRKVLSVQRRGKHLWFELDERPWPTFHFGMTGGFRTRGQEGVRLISSSRMPDLKWPPRFTKIHFIFDDGGELVMKDGRRLGRIRLRDDPLREPPISALGFDPLHDLPSSKNFFDLLHVRRLPMKALLLDQSFAAGVGNWIADEVLYQAQIDPRRKASTLTPQESARVRSKMQSIIAFAVSVEAQNSRYPQSWLFHHRWGRNASAQTSRGQRIVHATIGGRTTAWVPTVQK